MNHLIKYNPDLGSKLTSAPANYLPLFEIAVKESAKKILYANPSTVNNMEVPDCQVTLKSDANVIQIRDLNVK